MLPLRKKQMKVNSSRKLIIMKKKINATEKFKILTENVSSEKKVNQIKY